MRFVVNKTKAPLPPRPEGAATNQPRATPEVRESNQITWQRGYAVFSVSQSKVEAVKRYIENQEKHHRKMTFQDELRELFQRHEVEFEERYVWA
jgi:Transposase IS200 like